MKITDLDYLYVGYIYEKTNINKVLIYAFSKGEAEGTLKGYAADCCYGADVVLSVETLKLAAERKLGIENLTFDCDIIISAFDYHETKKDYGIVSLEDLDLSVRTYNCLTRAGYKSLADLYGKSENDLMKIRNLGCRSLAELVEKCRNHGLVIPEKG